MPTAEMQGRLWGTDASSWAEQEDRQAPIYAEVADRVGVGPGSRVLDLACGSGVYLALAQARGAAAAGLEASAALLEIAGRRAPGADLRQGDLSDLPWDDGAFDIVTGFNAFQFADDVIAALSEAARVTRPGGRVAIQVWGRPERCGLAPMVRAVAAHLPGPLPSPPGGGNYSDPGVLERLVGEAGLRPVEAGDVVCAFEYADDAEMLRINRSAGLIALAAQLAGDEAIDAAILDALAPFRTPEGGYRITNEWRWLSSVR